MTILFAFLFGAIVGSFLNVCIHRLPKQESIVVPRSRCPACQSPIRAVDNIPLLSFMLLRGRYRACGHLISWRYPLVEALTALLFVLTVSRFGVTLKSVFLLALDLLPDRISALRHLALARETAEQKGGESPALTRSAQANPGSSPRCRGPGAAWMPARCSRVPRPMTAGTR